MRRRVAVGAAAGMSHEELSIALNISRPTLEKYFEHELSVGAYQKRLDVLDAMYTTARKGNVAAQKAFAAASIHLSVPPVPASYEGDSQEKKPSPSEPAEKIGKKERQQRDAVGAHVGTEWNDLLTPSRPQ